MNHLFEILFWPAIGFISSTVYSSFFEWTLHRFVMHRPLGSFRYPFESHAIVHHKVFRADESYHLINPKDAKTIPMAWWNGPVLVLVAMVPFALAAWFMGHWGFYWGALLACASYYITYEYIHWCMHLPKKRHVERSGIFFRLNGHHLLHHRYMHKNFNVVMPLADLLLGTLLLRSPIHFQQPVGAAVPDVQPRLKIPTLAKE